MMRAIRFACQLKIFSLIRRRFLHHQNAGTHNYRIDGKIAYELNKIIASDHLQRIFIANQTGLLKTIFPN
jgi:tRNA nucleotidyltransferase/poly(A) polymerase